MEYAKDRKRIGMVPGFDGLAWPGAKIIQPLDAEMKIVIPTYMREDDQKTLKTIPEELHKATYLFTRNSRVPYLREAVSSFAPTVKIIGLPNKINGIVGTRQAIVDYFPDDKLWMIDDCVAHSIGHELALFEEGNKYKAVSVRDHLFGELYDHISGKLDNYGYGGLKSGLMNQDDRRKLKQDTFRVYGCVAIRTDVMSELGIKYTDMFDNYGSQLHEDYYVHLSFLTRGYPTFVTPQYVHNYKHGNKGGNSLFRTHEVQNLSVDSLCDKFPGIVKPKIVKSKEAFRGEMATRKEVHIYWQKAFKNACKKNLENDND